jgi:hypothetical protein
MNELFLQRPDLWFDFILIQPLCQLREKCIYRIIIPKAVEVCRMDFADARLVVEVQPKCVSAFIRQSGFVLGRISGTALRIELLRADMQRLMDISD